MSRESDHSPEQCLEYKFSLNANFCDENNGTKVITVDNNLNNSIKDDCVNSESVENADSSNTESNLNENSNNYIRLPGKDGQAFSVANKVGITFEENFSSASLHDWDKKTSCSLMHEKYMRNYQEYLTNSDDIILFNENVIESFGINSTYETDNFSCATTPDLALQYTNDSLGQCNITDVEINLESESLPSAVHNSQLLGKEHRLKGKFGAKTENTDCDTINNVNNFTQSSLRTQESPRGNKIAEEINENESKNFESQNENNCDVDSTPNSPSLLDPTDNEERFKVEFASKKGMCSEKNAQSYEILKNAENDFKIVEHSSEEKQSYEETNLIQKDASEMTAERKYFSNDILNSTLTKGENHPFSNQKKSSLFDYVKDKVIVNDHDFKSKYKVLATNEKGSLLSENIVNGTLLPFETSRNYQDEEEENCPLNFKEKKEKIFFKSGSSRYKKGFKTPWKKIEDSEPNKIVYNSFLRTAKSNECRDTDIELDANTHISNTKEKVSNENENKSVNLVDFQTLEMEKCDMFNAREISDKPTQEKNAVSGEVESNQKGRDLLDIKYVSENQNISSLLSKELPSEACNARTMHFQAPNESDLFENSLLKTRSKIVKNRLKENKESSATKEQTAVETDLILNIGEKTIISHLSESGKTVLLEAIPNSLTVFKKNKRDENKLNNEIDIITSTEEELSLVDVYTDSNTVDQVNTGNNSNYKHFSSLEIFKESEDLNNSDTFRMEIDKVCNSLKTTSDQNAEPGEGSICSHKCTERDYPNGESSVSLINARPNKKVESITDKAIVTNKEQSLKMNSDFQRALKRKRDDCDVTSYKDTAVTENDKNNNRSEENRVPSELLANFRPQEITESNSQQAFTVIEKNHDNKSISDLIEQRNSKNNKHRKLMDNETTYDQNAYPLGSRSLKHKSEIGKNEEICNHIEKENPSSKLSSTLKLHQVTERSSQRTLTTNERNAPKNYKNNKHSEKNHVPPELSANLKPQEIIESNSQRAFTVIEKNHDNKPISDLIAQRNGKNNKHRKLMDNKTTCDQNAYPLRSRSLKYKSEIGKNEEIYYDIEKENPFSKLSSNLKLHQVTERSSQRTLTTSERNAPKNYKNNKHSEKNYVPPELSANLKPQEIIESNSQRAFTAIKKNHDNTSDIISGIISDLIEQRNGKSNKHRKIMDNKTKYYQNAYSLRSESLKHKSPPEVGKDDKINNHSKKEKDSSKLYSNLKLQQVTESNSKQALTTSESNASENDKNNSPSKENHVRLELSANLEPQEITESNSLETFTVTVNNSYPDHGNKPISDLTDQRNSKNKTRKKIIDNKTIYEQNLYPLRSKSLKHKSAVGNDDEINKCSEKINAYSKLSSNLKPHQVIESCSQRVLTASESSASADDNCISSLIEPSPQRKIQHHMYYKSTDQETSNIQLRSRSLQPKSKPDKSFISCSSQKSVFPEGIDSDVQYIADTFEDLLGERNRSRKFKNSNTQTHKICKKNKNLMMPRSLENKSNKPTDKKILNMHLRSRSLPPKLNQDKRSTARISINYEHSEDSDVQFICDTFGELLEERNRCKKLKKSNTETYTIFEKNKNAIIPKSLDNRTNKPTDKLISKIQSRRKMQPKLKQGKNCIGSSSSKSVHEEDIDSGVRLKSETLEKLPEEPNQIYNRFKNGSIGTRELRKKKKNMIIPRSLGKSLSRINLPLNSTIPKQAKKNNKDFKGRRNNGKFQNFSESKISDKAILESEYYVEKEKNSDADLVSSKSRRKCLVVQSNKKRTKSSRQNSSNINLLHKKDTAIQNEIASNLLNSFSIQEDSNSESFLEKANEKSLRSDAAPPFSKTTLSLNKKLEKISSERRKPKSRKLTPGKLESRFLTKSKNKNIVKHLKLLPLHPSTDAFHSHTLNESDLQSVRLTQSQRVSDSANVGNLSEKKSLNVDFCPVSQSLLENLTEERTNLSSVKVNNFYSESGRKNPRKSLNENIRLESQHVPDSANVGNQCDKESSNVDACHVSQSLLQNVTEERINLSSVKVNNFYSESGRKNPRGSYNKNVCLESQHVSDSANVGNLSEKESSNVDACPVSKTLLQNVTEERTNLSSVKENNFYSLSGRKNHRESHDKNIRPPEAPQESTNISSEILHVRQINYSHPTVITVLKNFKPPNNSKQINGSNQNLSVLKCKNLPVSNPEVGDIRETELCRLVKCGLLKPGFRVLTVHTPERLHFASLNEMGLIIAEDGKMYNSIRQWCSSIPNCFREGQVPTQSACSGIVYYQGRTLSHYEQAYLNFSWQQDCSLQNGGNFNITDGPAVPLGGDPLPTVLDLSKMKLLLIGNNEVESTMSEIAHWVNVDKW